MSERGSYVSEFMYCPVCQGAVHAALKRAKMGPWKIHKGAIVAGFYRMTPGFSGEERLDFEERIAPMIAKAICHPVRFAVLSDDGKGALYKVFPEKDWMSLLPSRGAGIALQAWVGEEG